MPDNNNRVGWKEVTMQKIENPDVSKTAVLLSLFDESHDFGHRDLVWIHVFMFDERLLRRAVPC